ncbi:MAG: hypothetical protein HY744_26655 [Deltaproteobacteria bacterium]|nr:hypothetical protein [Deltaproteobacteria bacterium]
MRRARWPRPAIAVLATLVGLCLGWLVAEATRGAGGRDGDTPTAEPARPRVLIDAGAVRLLGDASLELRPLAPPRLE